jgi:hypothetical protein
MIDLAGERFYNPVIAVKRIETCCSWSREATVLGRLRSAPPRRNNRRRILPTR